MVAEFGCRNSCRKDTRKDYHKVICLNSECKPWIIHVMSLLVILSTYAMEDGQTATSVPHHHMVLLLFDHGMLPSTGLHAYF